MSYEPHVWETGEVITAQKLNHMEDSIGAFYVPVTVTMNDQSQPTYSTEVSVYDILDAYNSGKAVYVAITDEGAVNILSLSYIFTDGSPSFGFNRTTVVGGLDTFTIIVFTAQIEMSQSGTVVNVYTNRGNIPKGS